MPKVPTRVHNLLGYKKRYFGESARDLGNAFKHLVFASTVTQYKLMTAKNHTASKNLHVSGAAEIGERNEAASQHGQTWE